MKIALLGNPNTGKSTVFNMLTGLRQHVGNFPGVTVDKKVGKIIVGETAHELIDFPGTYSIYPRSKDEEVVYKIYDGNGTLVLEDGPTPTTGEVLSMTNSCPD